MNLVMQLIGVVLLLFLIYDHVFNCKEKRRYKKNYGRGINFVGLLGHVDLILGVLLLVKFTYGVIPMSIILFLVVILFLKALPFVWGGDVASVIDIFSSIVIFSSGVVEIPVFIMIGISIYLIQKGFLSLLN